MSGIHHQPIAAPSTETEKKCWCDGSLAPSVHDFYGKCKTCGTLVLTRTPTADDLKKYYSMQGYWIEHQIRDNGFPDIKARATLDLNDRIPVWHRLLTQVKPKIGSLLEIGCAHGGFLNYCRERGVKTVVGVEVDEETCRFASENFNLPHICCGLFPAVKLPVERFDAIAGFDVLEHFLDPVAALQGVAARLEDGGAFIFQTPCYHGKEDVKWSQFKPAEHIYLYSAASVRALCARAGLEVTEIAPGYFPEDMFVIGRKKPLLSKPRVAGNFTPGKDFTEIQQGSQFETQLRGLIRMTRPKRIIETGTYLGKGTTRVIAEAIRDFGLNQTVFTSIECNPDHHRQALSNLKEAGLVQFVRPLLGLSVPRSLLPTADVVHQETIAGAAGTNVFVDHQENQRVELYLRETDFPDAAEDLLGTSLQECGNEPDLVLLDSGGHMGNVEFNFLISRLRGSCYVVLDDVKHIKHARSLEQMKADPRFEIICELDEKFGACFAKFEAAAPVSVQPIIDGKCWCGGALTQSVHELYGRCVACGTQVLRKQSTPAELKEFYGFDHYWHEHQTKDLSCPPIEQRAADDLKDRVPVWHKLLTQFKPGTQTLLEIGCAHGGFLHYSREHGIPTVVGVEVDEATCEFARNHFGLSHVYSGLFPAVKLPIERFDAITGFDVLEHLPDPVGALKAVAGLLADDGVFVFQLPCYRGEGREWRMFCPINHVFLYTEESLHKLFVAAGLEVDKIVPGHFPEDVFVLGRKPGNRQRLLWVRTDSIGDAVLASAMLEPLRQHHPQAKLAVLCQQHVAELFTACPLVDSVICYDRKQVESNPAERAQILAEIAAFKPDVVLNTVRSRDRFSDELTLAIPGAKYIAIESDLNNITAADHAAARNRHDLIVSTPDTHQTELQRHTGFLHGLGITAQDLRPVTWTTPDDELLADEFFKSQGLDARKTIALFPGAQHDVRIYRGYAEVLKDFSGYHFLIFGDASQTALADEIGLQLPGRTVNLCGRSSLRETIALVRRCRLYVGAESAGAHIACAVGVQNVVLLGGGHFGRFMPYSPLTSAVSLPLDCFGCNWRCPHKRAHCIKDIAPNVITRAILEALEKDSRRTRLYLQTKTASGSGHGLPTWQRPDDFLVGMDVEIIHVDPILPALKPKIAVAAEPYRLAPTPAHALPQTDPMKALYQDVERSSQAAGTSVTAVPALPALTNPAAPLPCPVCQTVAPHRLTKLEHNYHICPACECVFTPQIKSTVLQTENNGHSARHNENQDALRLQRLVTTLGRQPEHVIDFGCGNGETTRFIQSKDIRTTGIDQDTAVQLKDVADSSADGIMMVEVIEHLFAPNEIFSQFNRVLKPGGAIYVESSFADKQDLPAWPYLNPAIGHCTVHALRSMDLVAAKNGFEITWLNPNVCCFIKKTKVTPTAEKAMPPGDVEIVGEGILEPIVTAVISTYQSEKFMRACLENLTRQTIFDRCEVMVVDSGSPENERAIVEEFQQKFPNIRYLRTPRETLYAAWNRGLGIARGRYWANVNTDDSLRDDALEIMAASLDKHTDCAMSYADCAWTTKPNDTFPSGHIIKTVKYPDYAPVETLFYCVTGCLQFFRTASLRQVGGFESSLKCAGDYEATLKIMAARMNAVHVPEVLSLFFQNTGGLTQASNRAALEHDMVMDRYRNGTDISAIFQVDAADHRAKASALAVLGMRAMKFSVPWEDSQMEHNDFAFACFNAGLSLDPESATAGMSLLALYHKLNRLGSVEAELTQRWPKMREWIASYRSGERVILPHLNHAVRGPAYRPGEWSQRPTAEQLAQEPKALQPWITRIEGRHVYLSEDLFPQPSGLRYEPKELDAAAKRLVNLLGGLPPFYAHLGGAGDALMLLAAFYDQKPDGVVFCHPNGVGAAKALFDAFPKLSKIYFLPQHAEPFFHIVLRYALYELKNCLGAGTTPQFGYEEEWKASLDIEKKYRVKKAPRWAAAFRKNEKSRRVAVAPKGSLSGMIGSKRNIILPELWPQVIAHIIERGFEPVILGLANEAKTYPALPGCVDARKESFAGQMRVIGECAGLVGADSWAKTFSALAEIPTLVFEPIKGADLGAWKDPSDWVFIEPWPSIKMIRSLEDFKKAFDGRIAKIAGAVEAKKSKPVIAWEGSFLDYGSLSHVNRELTARLPDVTCVGPNILPERAKNDAEMKRCAGKLEPIAPANTAVTIRHQWPPNWSRPESGLLVVIQPWEFGSLPKTWVEQAGKVDEFWVPSPLVRHMYVDSGVAPEKVRVVPNGVDTKKFRPGVAPLKLATKKKFKFLFVGGTIFRKGPDILLEAYSRAFTAADDVCLVIKDFGGDSFYQGQTAEAAIAELKKNPEAPEILYLKEELSSAQMPALYAACDCFVLPYRGEGFGMPVLEAMACGLPVVVTAGGATESFVTPEVGWKIPAQAMRLNGHVGDIALVKSGWLMEPSKPHLSAILKYVLSHRDDARKRGAAGRAAVERRFDWSDVAAAVAHRLKELAELSPVQAIAEKADEQVRPATVAASKPVKIVMPAVGKIGRLDEARELFAQKNFEAAWNATLAAIAQRPFHPEAFLLLAEVALAAGDGQAAKQCAEQARALAPGFEAAKKFLKQKFGNGAKAGTMNAAAIIKPQAAPRLSVCVITKNEEKFLAQCLKSVRGLAAQIVVVDTGSTDRTVEIAKEFGAELYAFTWCDDFAAARNAALEHATGDWILILDADEEVTAAQHAKLQADLKNAAMIGYRLPLVNFGQENEGRSFIPRLFRNAPGVFFHGRIHEQVFSSLLPLCKQWGLQTALGAAELLHYGYTKEMVRDRNKVERNLNLLRQAITENPTDLNLVMNLGLELVRSDDLQGGIVKYREAFALMSAQPATEVVPELREALLTQFTSQLYKVRGHEEILRTLNSPLAKNGGLNASLHLALGLAYFELKRFSEAADQMRQCLATNQKPALTPINVDIHGAAPWHCLALCLARTGDAKGAEAAFQSAITETRRSEEARLDYARFLRAENRPVDALQQLHPIVAQNPGSLAAWKLGGEISLSQAEFIEFARDWTGEAMAALPGNAVLTGQRAEALMLNGDTAAAMELWEKLWSAERQPNSLAALILCEVIEAQTTHAPDEGQEEAVTSKAFIEWYQKLITHRVGTVIDKINEQQDKLSRALPTAAQILQTALAEAVAA